MTKEQAMAHLKERKEYFESRARDMEKIYQSLGRGDFPESHYDRIKTAGLFIPTKDIHIPRLEELVASNRCNVRCNIPKG